MTDEKDENVNIWINGVVKCALSLDIEAFFGYGLELPFIVANASNQIRSGIIMHHAPNSMASALSFEFWGRRYKFLNFRKHIIEWAQLQSENNTYIKMIVLIYCFAESANLSHIFPALSPNQIRSGIIVHHYKRRPQWRTISGLICAPAKVRRDQKYRSAVTSFLRAARRPLLTAAESSWPHTGGPLLTVCGRAA